MSTNNKKVTNSRTLSINILDSPSAIYGIYMSLESYMYLNKKMSLVIWIYNKSMPLSNITVVDTWAACQFQIPAYSQTFLYRNTLERKWEWIRTLPETEILRCLTIYNRDILHSALFNRQLKRAVPLQVRVSHRIN